MALLSNVFDYRYTNRKERKKKRKKQPPTSSEQTYCLKGLITFRDLETKPQSMAKKVSHQWHPIT